MIYANEYGTVDLLSEQFLTIIKKYTATGGTVYIGTDSMLYSKHCVFRLLLHCMTTPQRSQDIFT